MSGRGSMPIVARGPGAGAVVLLVCALGALGCDEPVSIEVNVKGLTAEVRSLAVQARVGELPAVHRTVTRRLDRFILRLPPRVPGEVALEVDGIKDSGCPVARGQARLQVPMAGRHAITLALAPKEPPGCRLEVRRIGDGEGEVSGGGVACGEACEVEAALGEEVELQAVAAEGSVFGGWSGACTGLGECRARVRGPAERVEAAFIRKEACGDDGWCWKNPLPRGDGLRSVFGLAGNDIWAVGASGVILRYNGSFWVPYPSGTSHVLVDV